jgi:hypothetical protein
MSPKTEFLRLVTAARRAVPGGRLNKADLHGLSRRATAMGIEAATSQKIIDMTELQARPRHPITRGIE